MTSRSLSRRTLLKGTGAVTIGLPLLEEMLRPSPVSAKDSRPEIPVRAFNVFFGLGIPAPLQTEGFDGVLEPLKPLNQVQSLFGNLAHIIAPDAICSWHVGQNRS